MMKITKPTATQLSTVVIPVQSADGKQFVFELSLAMWRSMRDAVDTEFVRIYNLAQMNAAVIDIERHESVV